MREGLESCRSTETAESAESADQTFPDNASISDLESELQTDQSVLGSPFDHSTGTNKGQTALNAEFNHKASLSFQLCSFPKFIYLSTVSGSVLRYFSSQVF